MDCVNGKYTVLQCSCPRNVEKEKSWVHRVNYKLHHVPLCRGSVPLTTALFYCYLFIRSKGLISQIYKEFTIKKKKRIHNQGIIKTTISLENECISYILQGFPSGTSGKEPMQETKETPWVGKSPGGGSITTHSSILAWRIPWTEEPGGLQSIG